MRLKIDILDKRNDKVVGLIVINLLSILKKNVKEGDTAPFDTFTTTFPIMKPQLYPDVRGAGKPMINYSEQIGEIELTLKSEFFSQAKKSDFGDYEKMHQFL